MVQYLVILTIVANAVGPGTHAVDAGIIGPLTAEMCLSQLTEDDRSCGSMAEAQTQMAMWGCDVTGIVPRGPLALITYTCNTYPHAE